MIIGKNMLKIFALILLLIFISSSSCKNKSYEQDSLTQAKEQEQGLEPWQHLLPGRIQAVPNIITYNMGAKNGTSNLLQLMGPGNFAPSVDGGPGGTFGDWGGSLLAPPPPPLVAQPMDELAEVAVFTGPIYSLCGNGKLDRVVNRIACPRVTPFIIADVLDPIRPCIGFVYIEQCDDGNTFSNDGCSSTCMKECCGNGIVEEGEQCDKGQNKGPKYPNISPPAGIPINSTGTLILEPLPPCADPKAVTDLDNCSRNCQLIICGDGIVNGSEQCDDGNDEGCDGCYRCVLETLATNNCCNCVPPPVE